MKVPSKVPGLLSAVEERDVSRVRRRGGRCGQATTVDRLRSALLDVPGVVSLEYEEQDHRCIHVRVVGGLQIKVDEVLREHMPYSAVYELKHSQPRDFPKEVVTAIHLGRLDDFVFVLFGNVAFLAVRSASNAFRLYRNITAGYSRDTQRSLAGILAHYEGDKEPLLMEDAQGRPIGVLKKIKDAPV